MPPPISHSVTLLFGAVHRNRKEQVRVASAIAIQTVWRKMKHYKRREQSEIQNQLNSKEVLLALETLKQVRVAPLDFEQDFAARVESKMWEMNAEIDELKGEIKRQHEDMRKDVLKEMALIQGRMSKAIVEEVRRANSRRSTPKLAPKKINKESHESGSTPKKKKSAARSSKSQSPSGHRKGNALTSMAAAKKQAARARSRRLSRD